MARHFSHEQKKDLLRTIWLPTLLILGSYASFQLYYNYRITGDALKLPYMSYHEKFEIAPMFSFENPNYKNAHGIGNFHKFQLTMLAKPHNMQMEEAFSLLSGILGLKKISYLFLDNHLIYAAGILLHLPLLYMLSLFFFARRKWPVMLPLLISAVASCIGFELMYWSVPHYMAPYFAALYVSLFVVVDDLKLHPLINWFLALLAITLLALANSP